jgi:hypothetical protein
MKNLILILFFFLIGISSNAQDVLEWTFQYTFTIENSRFSDLKMDSLEVFVNEPFNSGKLRKVNLSFNDSTKSYKVNLDYRCISCGFSDLKFPPTIILKLSMIDNSFNDNHHYSMLIPVAFEEITKPIQELIKPQIEFGLSSFELGAIDLQKFNSNNERLVGLYVKKNGSVVHYKQGEHEFPTTDKLIKID